MPRRWIVFPFLIAIVFSLLCLIALTIPGGEARDIHVDKDDADPSIQLGSEEFPYENINQAVDVAYDFDVIYVHASEEIYAENVVIDDIDSITIIGDSPETVIVSYNPQTFTIRSANHEIRGITFRGGFSAIDNSGWYNFIHHCVIQNATIGVMENGRGNAYRNNTFENCDYGFYLTGGEYSEINANSFEKVNFTIAMYGYELMDFDHQISDDNLMDGKPILYYRNLSHEIITFDKMNHTFLGFFDCDNLTIVDTEVTGLDSGILLANCADIEIYDSSFTDNNWLGIHVVFSVNVHIHNSGVTGNARYQISCHYSESIHLEDFVIDSEDYGIHLSQCHDSLLENLEVVSNEDGLRMEEVWDIIVKNSEFSGTGGSGSVIVDSDSITFLNCVFDGFQNGISVYDHGFMINITKTTISNCHRGIFIDRSFVHMDSSLLKSNTRDISIVGDTSGSWYNSSSLNMIIDQDTIEMQDNCSLAELQYLTVTVEDVDSDPVPGAEMIINTMLSESDEEFIVYSTPLYGGEDPLTPANGTIGPVIVVSNLFSNGSVESFLTRVNASFEGEEEMIELSIVETSFETIELDVQVEVNFAPEVEITDPEDGDDVSGTITIEGTATDPNGDDTIESVEIRVDGEDWEEAQEKGISGLEEWVFDFSFSGMDAGDYSIEARAYDGDLYSEIFEVEVTISEELVDNNVPEVTVTSPFDGEFVSGMFLITGEATDADGDETIEIVEFRIDGGSWIEANGTSSWNYEIATTALDDGDHTIDVQAFDGKDNSTIMSVGFIVDNGAPGEGHSPEILQLVRGNEKPKVGEDQYITATVHDEDGVDNIPSDGIHLAVHDGQGIEVMNVTWPTLTISEESGGHKLTIIYQFSIPTEWEGSYTITLFVEDSDGKTVEQSVTFDVEQKKDDEDDPLIDGIEDDHLFFGIIPGIIAVIIIAVVFIVKRGSDDDDEGVACPTCGYETEYVDEYDSYYCYQCEDYL